MPLTSIIIVAAIAVVFCAVLGSLIWAERRTRTRWED